MQSQLQYFIFLLTAFPSTELGSILDSRVEHNQFRSTRNVISFDASLRRLNIFVPKKKKKKKFLSSPQILCFCDPVQHGGFSTFCAFSQDRHLRMQASSTQGPQFEPGPSDIWIFVWPSFRPKLTQLSVIPG